MKKKCSFICAIIFALSCNGAEVEEFKEVYLDNKSNVHLLMVNGKHKQVTYDNRAGIPKISPDKKTVAWLLLKSWTAKGDDKPGSSEITIYHNAKFSTIKCGPFIRDFWFTQNGNQIAIDCGGRRFAGREILYDIETLKEIASFYQAEVLLERRPDWSNHDN